MVSLLTTLKKIFIDTTLDAEFQEIPAELQLRELDNALGKIQDLNQRHVVQLAEGNNLELSDFRQLTLLSEAAKSHSYDEHLREVQILPAVLLDGSDPSLEEYAFEDALTSAIQNALYKVSTKYRVDMEIERQEQGKLDISDLSDEDVQNLEF